jgi:hypothetical protein
MYLLFNEDIYVNEIELSELVVNFNLQNIWKGEKVETVLVENLLIENIISEVWIHCFKF